MAGEGGPGIEIRILGPLALIHHGHEIPLRGAKERALLVRLAVEPGRIVSTDRLIEDLWDGSPPERALDTLRVYVSHLRKALPSGSIGTKQHGYVLTVGDIDVVRFATLVARARNEEPEAAVRTLREALSLWRGAALADVADAAWARGRAAQLEEERVAALEARVGADLARGAHAELIGELEVLTAEHPLRERLWEHRIVALYRAGRQADALAAYRELRRILSEELGLDPSPDLQAVERKVLDHDPSLIPPVPPPDRELDGAVTFLFSDIEGSTRLWDEHPEEMEDAVRAHDEILRTSVDRHGGLVFKHTGDGICAAFGAPRDALAAALDVQRNVASHPWQELRPIRVRLAVHSGNATRRDGDFFGPALNRCARLLDAGHGGQVLVSEATAHLVDEPPDGATLVDLGVYRLRDLGTPQRIFRLAHGELAAGFPPLRAVDEGSTNLPVEASSFVGRQRELAQVAEALAESRIVTLTGVGGVGKTRLALRAAAEAMHAYADGVWLCELAPVATAAAVEEAVSGAVRVSQGLGGRTGNALIDFLRQRELLLILDNCEHVLSAAASVAERIAGSCPGVRILATSREGLAVAGERMIAVPSLPAPGAGAGTEAIRATDASRLFLERARAASDGFELTPENAGAVAEICRRLDGIPLALELAAARVHAMTADEIARRLDQRFRLLTGGRRTASERHQALRRTIDWSYDLLEDMQRLALDRLSVFAGGFTLEAAEAVIAGGGIGAGTVLDLVIGLVDRSLVVSERDPSGAGRYGMLETVRQYAEERLAERGEVGELRRRHALYLVEFVERTAPLFRGPQEPAAVTAVDREVDNLRAAAGWCIEEDETELAMRLTAPLWWEKITERTGRAVGAWAERVIEMDAAENDPRFELACVTAAMAAWNRGAGDTARSLAQRAAAVAADRGRSPHLLTRHVIGLMRYYDGDQEGLRRNVDEYLERIGAGEGADDLDLVAYMLASAAGARFTLGDPRTIDLGERAVRLAREAGSPSTLVYALFLYAVTQRLFEGREAVSVSALEEAVAVQGVTRRFWQRQSEVQLARYRAGEGDIVAALRLMRSLLIEAHRSGDRGEYLMYAVSASIPFALAGDDESSVLTEEVLAALGYPIQRGVDQKLLDEARERLGKDAVEAVAARAAGMSVNELNDLIIAAFDRLIAAHERAGDG